MGALHLVSRSPHESSSLAQCLERVAEGDAVLLLAGAVYAALKDSVFAPRLQAALARVEVCALAPDLAARGVAAEEVLAGLVLVDYEGFVALSLRHAPALSW